MNRSFRDMCRLPSADIVSIVPRHDEVATRIVVGGALLTLFRFVAKQTRNSLKPLNPFPGRIFSVYVAARRYPDGGKGR